MENTSASTIAINIFVAPAEALRALQAHNRFLLPLLILMILPATIYAIYLTSVDLGWFFERLLVQNPQVTEGQAAQIGDSMADIPPGLIAGIAAPAIAISVLISLLVQALYFKIVSLFGKVSVRYGLWFGVVCFCALPTALRSLSAIANLLVSDIRLLPLEKVNSLAFVNLFGIEPSGKPLESIIFNLDPLTIWSLGLLCLAMRIVGGKSWFASLAVVLTPIALVVAVWAAF